MSQWMLFGSPEPAPDVSVPVPDPKLLEVHRRLCATYGCPVPYFHELDPLSELISSLLSHRTKNRDSGAAFRELRSRFPTWEQVRDAPVAEVQAAISRATWPEQKAPRIQQVLWAITAERGEPLSLDFLSALSIREAREWLESLPGVGPKTSAAVLAFSSLHRRALPVDSHHHRVVIRLGIIPATMPVGESHAVLEGMLPADWDAQRVYDHHEVLMFHGQRCCYHARPECHRCPLLDLCPEGQRRMRGNETALPGSNYAAESDKAEPMPERRAVPRVEP